MLLQNGFHPIVHEQPYTQKVRCLSFASHFHIIICIRERKQKLLSQRTTPREKRKKVNLYRFYIFFTSITLINYSEVFNEPTCLITTPHLFKNLPQILFLSMSYALLMLLKIVNNICHPCLSAFILIDSVCHLFLVKLV